MKPAIVFACWALALPSYAIADPYSSAVLSNGPIGYWRLGEAASASTALDSGSNNLDGTYLSSVTPGAAGAIQSSTNTAATFIGDGFNGGFVDIGYEPLLDLTHSFTIEAWFKTAAVGGTQRILSNRFYGGSFGEGYGLGIEDSHLIFSAFGVEDYRTSDVVIADEWFYVAVVVDALSAPSFYLNGQPFEAFPSSGAIVASSSAFQIGRNPMADGVSSFEPFNGVLDEVAIYGTPLEPEVIEYHYNASIPEPTSAILAAVGAAACVIGIGLRRQRA